MHRLRPARYAPAILAACAPLLQVGELPQVVHSIEVADLHEPRAHALHHLPAGLQPPTPVCLPLEEVSGVQCVRSQFEKAAQLAGRGGGPETEFLHQGRLLLFDQRSELAVEFGVLGVLRDGVQGTVVAGVTLVLPDVDWALVSCMILPRSCRARKRRATKLNGRTECVAVSHLCPPASDQMNLILGHRGHAGIPLADELDILIDLVGLDLVEDDAVDVLAAGNDLGEAGLKLRIMLPAFFGAVDEVGQRALLPGRVLFGELPRALCITSI